MKRSIVHFAMLAMVPAAFNLSGPASGGTMMMPLCTGDGLVLAGPPARAFRNCSEARALGAAPVRRGDPGYGPHLDRDGDGVLTANELPGAVPDEVREERRARLMDFQEDISTQRLEAKIDREMTVLVDEVDEEGALARSPGDAPEIDGLVIIPEGDGLAPGDFVRVRITDCDVHDLYAERIE